MNKMFLAALLAISGGSIATAMSKEGPSPTASAITESTFRKDNIT